MRCHHMSVRELDPEARVRECFHDHAFKLDDIILLCQNNPSFALYWLVTQKSFSTNVRIITPSLVRATVFS